MNDRSRKERQKMKAIVISSFGGPEVLTVTELPDPGGRLSEGTAVVAILGGMGRTRNGSYAELVTVPASNVVEVSTSLPWTDLAALPEVYATAWAGLRQNLDLRPGQTVLIRGATSALGQAAVNVAAGQGATVIATTRKSDLVELLERIGAKTVLIDDGRLAGGKMTVSVT
jgi:NADPH:quinone reductase